MQRRGRSAGCRFYAVKRARSMHICFCCKGSELEAPWRASVISPPPQGLRPELAEARLTPAEDDQPDGGEVALTSVAPPDLATLGFRVKG